MPSSSEPIYASTNHHGSGNNHQDRYPPVSVYAMLVFDSYPVTATLQREAITKGVFKTEWQKTDAFPTKNESDNSIKGSVILLNAPFPREEQGQGGPCSS